MVSQLETHQGLIPIHFDSWKEGCKLGALHSTGPYNKEPQGSNPACTWCPWLVLIQAMTDLSWLWPETLDRTPAGSHSEQGSRTASQHWPAEGTTSHCLEQAFLTELQASPGQHPGDQSLPSGLPCPHPSQPLSMIPLP